MQAIGITATSVYTAILSYLLVKIIDSTIGLKVNLEDETIYLDIALHDERAYDF